LLDEPFSGLDPLVRDQVLDEILGEAHGMTIVISSHDLDEIEGLATHVAFLKQGALRVYESAEALSARFRAVSLTLEDAATAPADLPPTWLEPRALGRTLSFVDSAFTSQAALAAQATARLGAVRTVDVRPMTLRDISKRLMAAPRGETGQ
jgi:ABC-2 type transport system ATP-binding protein